MNQPYTDNKKQLERIQKHILKNEILYAVLDLKGIGSGFIGVTDRRVIFYDQGFLSKKKSVISIPIEKIIAVASADDGILIPTNELTLITPAGNFNFEFMGADKSHYAYQLILTVLLKPQKQDTITTQ